MCLGIRAHKFWFIDFISVQTNRLSRKLVLAFQRVGQYQYVFTEEPTISDIGNTAYFDKAKFTTRTLELLLFWVCTYKNPGLIPLYNFHQHENKKIIIVLSIFIKSKQTYLIYAISLYSTITSNPANCWVQVQNKL